MKVNKIVLSILALTFIALALQSVSAIIPDGTEVIISANDGFYTRDYKYVDFYNRPQYRAYIDDDYDLKVNAYQYNNYPRNYLGAYNFYNNPNLYGIYNNQRLRYFYFDKNDVKRYLTRQKISRFIDRSAYSRYDLNYGQNSEVFCDTLNCQDKSQNPTNFRYKHTYDPRIEGTGSYQNYYYTPMQDPNTGAYNWRY